MKSNINKFLFCPAENAGGRKRNKNPATGTCGPQKQNAKTCIFSNAIFLRKAVILIFLAVLLGMLLPYGFSEAQAPEPTFPGLNFLPLKQKDLPGVVAALYQFGLGLVLFSALIMLVLGGVTYMTAGDSTDRIGKAKTYMKNAIFGMLLALLSFLILQVINPDLVAGIKLESLKKID